MIALDTNVLVYAHRRDLPLHTEAVDVVTAALAGSEPVALCWPALHEFVSVVTHRKVFRRPTPTATAIAQAQDWVSSPVARVLGESPRHLDTLADLCTVGRVHGPVVHDARIAAICLDNGVRELWTADRDFTRFPALRVRNPFIPR